MIIELLIIGAAALTLLWLILRPITKIWSEIHDDDK